MAQNSGSKRSKFGLERHHPGCIESLLHFAIFQGSWQQRLHLKKMIAYKRHTDTSRPPRIKVPKVQHCVVKEGSNLQVGECKLGSPGKSPTKSPTKSPRKDLFKPLKFKKKSSEKSHRRCITSLPHPLASRLARTVSMHHLKSCNYVLPNESSDDQETTNDRDVSHCSGSPSTSKFLQNEPQKTCQQCGSVSRLNSVDQIHHSKDLLDFLQFFNENKNLLMNLARNPQILLAKEPLEKQASSNEGIELNKSQTFPRPGQPKNKEPHVPSTTPNNSKSIRSDVKKAIKENKKEVIHIANDGFLHRVPYGQKDHEGHKRNYRKEGVETQMRRSTSLSESLEKYSNLFESISKEEPKLTDSRAGSLQKRSSDLVFKRIHSSPEIKPYAAFVPPFSVTASFIDAPDIKSVHSCPEAESEPLENALGINEEEVEQLDLQLCTNRVKKLDPESHDHECIQPNMEANRNYNSPLSDDTTGISPKQSASDSSLKSDNMDSNESKLQEDETKVHVNDLYNIGVDESDAAYFLYMKDILAKSGLMGSEWYSSEQPVIDPAFLELEPDSGPDQVLLFDLLNEALLDAYESSLLSGTWVPRCGFVTRQLHLGERMIEEVWARLKRQLNSFVEVAIEDVVAADFLKNRDGWMDLNYDSELVGLDLEDWIVEDLIDEIVLEIGESQIYPSF
ncbi:Protein TRM32 [Carex littledalei]|uniref:Protein TRM32 n=1 Tax=Carex littledalei TaxID=544730 RepID=A0A833R4X8_9POAL|nr:Protein TRM32 [Carex littledalei]